GSSTTHRHATKGAQRMDTTHKHTPDHTPGPWDYIWWDDEGLWVGFNDSTKPVIARVETNKEADARLIAAAPDLLEAARALIEAASAQRLVGDGEARFNHDGAYLRALRDAIAKAEREGE